MKKIVSLFLCIVMLLGAMSIGAFAKDYYAGAAAATAPKIDGVVSEGEYSWTSGALSPTIAEDNRVYLGQGTSTATAAQFYLSYDKDYIYVAFVEVGSAVSRVWFDLNPRVGLSNSTGQIYIPMKIENGAVSGYSVNERTADAGTNKTEDYLVEIKAGSVSVGKTNTNTVEFQLKRSALQTYADGKSFDKLGFRAFTQIPAGNAEIFFYADKDSSVKPVWFRTDLGYHVINLNNNGKNPVENDTAQIGPVVIDPSDVVVNDGEGFKLEKYGQKHYTVFASESAPAVDGIIGADEYTLRILDMTVGDDAKDDRFFDMSGAGDVTDFSLYAGYDKEYIYFAATVAESDPVAWKDCAHFFLGSKNDPGAYVSCYVPLNAASKGHIEGNGIYGYEGEGAEKFDTATFSKYISSTAASLAGNVATYEVAFKRSAFDNASNLHFGFDAFASGQGYVIFGFQNEELSGYGTMKAGSNAFYPHVIEVSTEFKTIDENHEHTYGAWKRSGQTHHKRTCECGEIEYGFHAWGEGEITREPTAEKDGQIKYTCTVCNTTVKDDLPLGAEIPTISDPETEAPAVDDPATEAPVTEAPTTETEAPAATGGCGSSVAAVGVALVAMLGTCAIFVEKRR